MAEVQDSITLLKADHDKVDELFAQFEKAKGDGRKQKLALEISKELTFHAMIEEEIFLPGVRGQGRRSRPQGSLCRTRRRQGADR